MSLVLMKWSDAYDLERQCDHKGMDGLDIWQDCEDGVSY